MAAVVCCSGENVRDNEAAGPAEGPRAQNSNAPTSELVVLLDCTRTKKSEQWVRVAKMHMPICRRIASRVLLVTYQQLHSKKMQTLVQTIQELKCT